MAVSLAFSSETDKAKLASDIFLTEGQAQLIM